MGSSPSDQGQHCHRHPWATVKSERPTEGLPLSSSSECKDLWVMAVIHMSLYRETKSAHTSSFPSTGGSSDFSISSLPPQPGRRRAVRVCPGPLFAHLSEQEMMAISSSSCQPVGETND